MPYYLRYASKESRRIEKISREANRALRAEHASKLTPGSTPQFSRLIAKLYPRDTLFASLSIWERFQSWREQYKQVHPEPRGINVRKLPNKLRTRDYLPEEMPLVRYLDHTPFSQELQYAKQGIEQADMALKELMLDFKNDDNIALDQVRPAVELLSESVISNPTALLWLVRMQAENTETYSHSLKVAVYLMTLGRHLGFSPELLTELGFIGLLLDVASWSYLLKC